MKLDKDFFKNITFKFSVDISSEPKRNMYLIYPKSYWLNDIMFKWTEQEIDNADNGYIGTKYGTDCYVTRLLKATSK